MQHLTATTKSTHSNFERAMRRGFWKRLWRRVQNQRIQLISFSIIRDTLKPYEQSDIGIRTIPLHRIVGSIGRVNEFDRDFMPTSEHIEDKWKHILMLQISGAQLPPVDVYKVDDTYYVIDGNHRVSVSHFLGIHYIDAHIIELRRN